MGDGPSTATPELDGMPPADAPPADKPPRKRRASRKRASTSDTPRPRAASPTIKRRLREVFNLAGGLVSLADAFDGQVILANADELAEAWAKVAERHPRIKLALDGFERGGIYGAAAIATASVLLPILAHHRLLPPSMAQLGAIVGGPAMPSPAPAGTADPFPRSPAAAGGTDPEPAPAGVHGNGSAAPLG